MSHNPSRREFLAASIALPGAGLGTTNSGAPLPVSSSPYPASAASSGELRYSTLGRTGLKLTRFGVGSASDPAVIDRAVNLGINYFSTARDYQRGNAERLLGSALKGKRQKVLLATLTIDLTLPGRPPQSQETTRFVLDQLNTSLKELGTDYLDVWFFHQKNSPELITDDLLEAALIAKKQGKIRFAGTSTHRLPVIAGWLVKNKHLDVVMSMYNFTMDNEMHAAIETVHKAGLGVIAIKVMAGGLRKQSGPLQLNRQGALRAALRWALSRPHVDAVITGVGGFDQLEDNFRSMSAPFTDEDKRLLAVCLEEIGPEYCRTCGRCDGACIRGLPVADILRYGTYADGYGQFDFGREKFLALPEEMRQVRCNLCPSCPVRCPFGVRVAERLGRAQDLFG